VDSVLAPRCGLGDHGADDPVADRLDQAAVLGRRDELGGGDHAALGVVPAQQRLDRDHLAGGDVMDRLVVQLELALSQCPPQPRGQRELAGGGLRLGGREADRAAALALGLIERGVGALEHVLVLRERGDADAGGDLELVAVDRERRREGRQQVLGDRSRDRPGVAGEVAEQEHELVARAGRWRGSGGRGGRRPGAAARRRAWPSVSLTILKRSRSM
jgi:hypothetical protein